MTQDGTVSLRYDNGPAQVESWLESESFDNLIQNGTTNLARKNFARNVAAARSFTLVFTEFLSIQKSSTFRVTGMTPILNQVLASCPGNALRAGERNPGDDAAIAVRLEQLRGR